MASVSRQQRPSSVSTSRLVLVCALLALLAAQAVSQTFSYSRGWKNGKRAGLRAPPLAASPAGVPVPVDDDGIRYIIDGRGEHRVAFPSDWQLVEAPPLRYAHRTPSRSVADLGADQVQDREER